MALSRKRHREGSGSRTIEDETLFKGEAKTPVTKDGN